jgi:hypothetical protein
MGDNTPMQPQSCMHEREGHHGRHPSITLGIGILLRLSLFAFLHFRGVAGGSYNFDPEKAINVDVGCPCVRPGYFLEIKGPKLGDMTPGAWPRTTQVTSFAEP